MKFNAELFAKMREATSLLQSDGPTAATAAIQQALQGGAMPQGAPPSQAWAGPQTAQRTMHDINPPFVAPSEFATHGASQDASGILEKLKRSFRKHFPGAMPDVTDVEDGDVIVEEESRVGRGRFISGSCTNASGTRKYKLYIPSAYRGHEGEAVPLVVMLHGCKQNPDDFAAGTRMNDMAEDSNCLVVYPAQAKNANGSNCWNWFQAKDQQREKGEPSLIADIVRQVAGTYHVDPKRVYIAGLSAGGAMATLVGNAYPDLFAAVGIHSGLPCGSAHDIPSAFAVMKSGAPPKNHSSSRSGIPVIMFHGDADQTVHPRNGEHAFAQCLNAEAAGYGSTTQKDSVPGGRTYTRTVQHGPDGKVIAEKWIIHGSGHAWSGGSRKGSYTDPKGPNASREMLRFFYTHAR
jgi:poly(hydroxyalkanoate) depolymerase family esterase